MRVAAVEDEHDGTPGDFHLACGGAAQAVSKRVCRQPGVNIMALAVMVLGAHASTAWFYAQVVLCNGLCGRGKVLLCCGVMLMASGMCSVPRRGVQLMSMREKG